MIEDASKAARRRPRILFVAPDMLDKDVSDKQHRLLRDIGLSGLPFLPLMGYVDVQTVVSTIHTTADFDVVIFMAHSFGEGVQLSPGEVLSAEMLGPSVRFGVELVTLLACESYALAEAICEAAGVDVIATIQPLLTDDAWRIGAQLVLAMSRGDSYRAAYEKAKPNEGRDFIYLTGRVLQARAAQAAQDAAQGAAQAAQAAAAVDATLQPLELHRNRSGSTAPGRAASSSSEGADSSATASAGGEGASASATSSASKVTLDRGDVVVFVLLFLLVLLTLTLSALAFVRTEDRQLHIYVPDYGLQLFPAATATPTPTSSTYYYPFQQNPHGTGDY